MPLITRCFVGPGLVEIFVRMSPVRPTTGARAALLDEYERAIADLKSVVARIDEASFGIALHPDDPDPNCRSIGSVMEHVVRCAYMYPTFIRRKRADDRTIAQPVRTGPATAVAFNAALDDAFLYTVNVLSEVPEQEMTMRAPGDLIVAPWGQQFDFDQLMEHAIVHILRHRRQIERFLRELRAR